MVANNSSNYYIYGGVLKNYGGSFRIVYTILSTRDAIELYRLCITYSSDTFIMSDRYGINFRHETVNNEKVTIVAPDVTNKDKEEQFLSNYL